MTRQEKRKENKGVNIGVMFSIILLFLTSIFLIYNIFLLGPIEPVLRYIFIGVIVLVNFIKLKKRKRVIKKKKSKKFIIYNIVLSIIFLLVGLFIYKFYNSIDSLSKDKNTYSSSLVVKNDSSITGIQDIEDNKIGMLNDENSYEGYIIPNEAIDKNNLESDNDIITYNSYTELLSALYDEEVDGVFLPTNYINMFSNVDGYENINNETKIVFTKTKTIKKKISFSKNKIDKPITILLTGIDSNVDGLSNSASSNSDTLIVVTFNPETLTATMLSIPRDSYVPISCFSGNEKSKITHSGWQGIDCVENTIEDFLDINIDYYVKLNFKGLVNLVDALGGIDVEVPQDLCTDSSDRTGEVCIKAGNQHLNGEEALVLARNRKQLARGDIDRGLNQQIVVKGILNAVQNNITNVNALSKLLDTLSKNMDTNFTTDEILSFYNVGKDILRKSNKSATDSINIIQLFLAGEGTYIYDSGTKLDLYYYILYKESVEKVSEAMNYNLGKTNPDMDKTFTWSIDENYQHIPLGKDINDFTKLYYSGNSYRPNTSSENTKDSTNDSTNSTNDSKEDDDSKEDVNDDIDVDNEDEVDDTDSKDDEDDPLDTITPQP